MIKRWCAYLALLLGMTVLYLAHQQWLTWFVLVAVFAAPWLSLVLSLPAMVTTRMDAVCPRVSDVTVNETLRIQVKGALPVPMYRCRLTVERSITGQRWYLRPGDVKISNQLPAAHCGKLICKLQRCRVYDYLGLFWIRIRRKTDGEMTVRPVAVPVKVPQSLEQMLARSWRPKFGGGFSENHELRLYRPGDNLKQIHWKLSAKTGKLITREAMEPLPGRYIISMDIRGEEGELDRKFGNLLWLGNFLLERQMGFEIFMLTGDGVQHLPVTDQTAFLAALDAFLGMEPAREGSIVTQLPSCQLHYHIGGGSDEK